MFELIYNLLLGAVAFCLTTTLIIYLSRSWDRHKAKKREQRIQQIYKMKFPIFRAPKKNTKSKPKKAKSQNYKSMK